MSALVVVPARQMSQGRPCKNREHWDKLLSCLLSVDARRFLVTDDPWIWRDREVFYRRMWLPMDHTHTVAQVVVEVLKVSSLDDVQVVLVLQPSSPTVNRSQYVQAAMDYLEHESNASSVVSVVPWEGEPPSKACTLNKQGELVIPPTPEPRQAHPQHYRRDGTVYAVRRQYAEQGDLYGPRPIPLLIDPKDSVTLD